MKDTAQRYAENPDSDYFRELPELTLAALEICELYFQSHEERSFPELCAILKEEVNEALNEFTFDTLAEEIPYVPYDPATDPYALQ